jgi:hypothetical protein
LGPLRPPGRPGFTRSRNRTFDIDGGRPGARVHADAGNISWSLLYIDGDYDDGDFLSASGQVINGRGIFYPINGALDHMVTDVTRGIRYSAVFWSGRCFRCRFQEGSHTNVACPYCFQPVRGDALEYVRPSFPSNPVELCSFDPALLVRWVPQPMRRPQPGVRRHVPIPAIESDAWSEKSFLALRPVVWLGSSTLPHLPWHSQDFLVPYRGSGRFLVISDGCALGEPFLALTLLGVPFLGVATSQTPDAVEACVPGFPMVRRGMSLRDIPQALSPLLQRGRLCGVVLCVKLAGLAASEGSPRVQLITHAASQIREALGSACPLLEIVETPTELGNVCARLHDSFQHGRFLIDTGVFGWISKRSAFWLKATERGFRHAEFQVGLNSVVLPSEFDISLKMVDTFDRMCFGVGYHGPPVPETLVLANSFEYALDPLRVQAGDQVPYIWSLFTMQADRSARRLMRDGKTQTRALVIGEWCHLLGLPTCLERRLQHSYESAPCHLQSRAPAEPREPLGRARARSLLFSASHVPSFVLALSVALQLPTQVHSAFVGVRQVDLGFSFGPDERSLRRRVQGSILDSV